MIGLKYTDIDYVFKFKGGFLWCLVTVCSARVHMIQLHIECRPLYVNTIDRVACRLLFDAGSALFLTSCLNSLHIWLIWHFSPSFTITHVCICLPFLFIWCLLCVCSGRPLFRILAGHFWLVLGGATSAHLCYSPCRACFNHKALPVRAGRLLRQHFKVQLPHLRSVLSC